MDTTDPQISFNEKGVCNHCSKFDNITSKKWFPDDRGKKKFDEIVEKIKLNGKDKEYDCIMGLSGGIDSSYLAYKMKPTGLRILAVHVDAGWNSNIAVKNIKKIVKKLEIDLHTHVIDWESIKDIHYAFFRSGVPNQDIPQDHAFFSALYKYATENEINYVVHGSNIATESILPTAWGYNAMDSRHIKAIHGKFGRTKVKRFPYVDPFKLIFYYPFIKRMKVVNPLNYMPYSKKMALDLLEKEFGYQYYGGKHFESKFTKFFQTFYLPEIHGYDKRKAHLSSLILSGEITREEALAELNEPLYKPDELIKDREYFIKKLDITEEEYYNILNEGAKKHEDYPSNAKLFELYGYMTRNMKFLLPKKFRTSV